MVELLISKKANPKKITAILSRSDILKERKKYLQRKKIKDTNLEAKDH